MGVRNIFVFSYFCIFLACPLSSGQLISQNSALSHCQGLQNAASKVLQELIGTTYPTTVVDPAHVKGFSGAGTCTCSQYSNFCYKLETYAGILGNMGAYLSQVMNGGITDNGYSEINPFFGLYEDFYVPSPFGGSGSGGGFQFHCGTQEIGGCGGGGGGGGFNNVNSVTPEVGGGGGCNIGSASLNYGCNDQGNTAIHAAYDCQTQSSSATWYSTLSNFKAKLLQCASNKQLTVQGGGGGGGGTSNNVWVGYGCSFAISVNGAPILNSPSSSYVQGPLMAQACVFLSCLVT